MQIEKKIASSWPLKVLVNMFELNCIIGKHEYVGTNSMHDVPSWFDADIFHNEMFASLFKIGLGSTSKSIKTP